MRAFFLSNIKSPKDQVTTLPFFLEGDAINYHHSVTK